MKTNRPRSCPFEFRRFGPSLFGHDTGVRYAWDLLLFSCLAAFVTGIVIAAATLAFRINEHFDAASDARLSSDEACAFECEHHLVH
jgi:hypothetical protein